MHVNETEVEFDYYLAIARIFDEGFPLIPHVHSEISSTLLSPRDDISEKCDTTPEECATNDAPSWVEKREI